MSVMWLRGRYTEGVWRVHGVYGGGLLVGKVQTGRSKIWLERWGGKK